jgi:diguanylate cyclase (GGDEF)-like protein
LIPRKKIGKMQILQDNSITSWKELEKSLAEESGLAVVIAEGETSTVISESNNNSICNVLQKTERFSPLCQSFCGEAFNHVKSAGNAVSFKCHAGLNYTAVPLQSDRFVAIIGRTFRSSEDYKAGANRVISGDWNQFEAEDIFENILLSSSSADEDKLANRLQTLDDDEIQQLLFLEETSVAPIIDQKLAITEVTTEPIEKNRSEGAEEFAAHRSFFGSLLSKNYREACTSALQFLAKQYKYSSLAWIERKEEKLEIAIATGKFRESLDEIQLDLNDYSFLENSRLLASIEVKTNAKSDGESCSFRLFPIFIGDEVRAAIGVGEKITERKKRQISQFCKNLASPLEILRLREQVERQSWLSNAVQKFSRELEKIDNDDFWSLLAQTAAEVLRAERSSLLVLDEAGETLQVKVAIGSDSESWKGSVGRRIAQTVLDSGKPLLVKDIRSIQIEPAPSEWLYKSKSFISYPITIGSRKVGVLNVTDKIGGGVYNELDLELLDAIVPQLAVALDRAALKNKAGEYQQLSITDGLTSLVNRRYLEIRLTEEIIRSQRHGFPMAFLMIDVDEFKSYNDKFGHPEGDKALKLVSKCLKETLRGADIAARYGGEEFSILLPQTTFAEAQIIAERIRERVESTVFPNRQITISLGVSVCNAQLRTSHDLIRAADKALYQAKRNGRNAVATFEEFDELVVK